MTKKTLRHQLKGIALGFFLGGVSISWVFGAEPTPAANEHSRIELLGDSYGAEGRLGVVDQSRIIFYRHEGSGSQAARVFVNGSYHATLVAGGYSPICLRQESVRVAVGKAKTGDRPLISEASAFGLRLGQTLYVRVDEVTPGQWSLQPVAEAAAQAELGGTRLQIHTRSRVESGEPCRYAEATPAAAQPSLIPAVR